MNCVTYAFLLPKMVIICNYSYMFFGFFFCVCVFLITSNFIYIQSL